jgi:hypothetical protein
VDVGAADPDPSHAHLHLARSRRIDRLFGEAEFPLSYEFGDEHTEPL